MLNGMPILVPQAVKAGWIEVPPGGLFDYSYPTSKNRRGRVQGGGMICPAIMHGQSLILYYEGIEIDAMKPRHGLPVRSMMMQKVGDRDKDMVSVKGIAFCVDANPMSDRQQMVIEWDEIEDETNTGLQPWF